MVLACKRDGVPVTSEWTGTWRDIEVVEGKLCENFWSGFVRQRIEKDRNRHAVVDAAEVGP